MSLIPVYEYQYGIWDDCVQKQIILKMKLPSYHPHHLGQDHLLFLQENDHKKATDFHDQKTLMFIEKVKVFHVGPLVS